MKHYLYIAGFGVALILSGCTNSASTTQNQSTNNVSQLKEADVSVTKQFSEHPGQLADEKIHNKLATITTDKGTITFELYADDAPLTVSNFVFLTEKEFFNGLTFHRVEPGFVVQGGDPAGNGTGGPGYTFADEPVDRDYTRGIVAMANSGPDTNGSQFFIMLQDTPLPPQYTIFGEVTEGMNIVDQIRVGDVMTSVSIQDK